MSARGLRAALLAGGAFAVVVAGASFANAQDANVSANSGQTQNVNFTDAQARLQGGEGRALDLTVREDRTQRFIPADSQPSPNAEGPRRMELALSASAERTGAPLDISIAQRASLGSDANGDIDHHGRGSEVRVGRGLVQERGERRQGSAVYAFVSSDDQALTWRPGSRSDFGGSGSSFALQDQVQVGDHAAGVTYENNGVQASLAYVERQVSTHVGRESFSQDANFAGVTVTMRH
jgi:hypothetical protein